VTNGLISNLDVGNSSSYPGSGTSWFDLTANNNNTILYNGPTYQTYNLGALLFDGTDDYSIVTFNNRSSTVNTIEMFFRWRSGSGGMFLGFSSYDIWTDSGALGFNTSAGDLYGISNTKVGEINLIGTSSSNIHHYVFVFYNQIINNKIYIDTKLQTLSQIRGTTDLNANRGFTSTFKLSGWMNGTGYCVNGDFFNVKLYNRELSQTEIIQNFNALRGRYGI
jgi:hypothetical protein